MSDGLIFDNSESFCSIEKKEKNQKTKLRILKILFFVLLSFVLIELILYSLVIPVFQISNFLLQGLKRSLKKK